MKKFFIIFFTISILTLQSCSNKESMFENKVLNDISTIKISNFQNLNDYNSNIKKIYTNEKDIKIFQNTLKNTSETTKTLKHYNYDLLIEFNKKDGKYGERLIHLKIGNDDCIYLKYIGDSSKIYKVNQNQSKKLIDIIK